MAAEVAEGAASNKRASAHSDPGRGRQLDALRARRAPRRDAGTRLWSGHQSAREAALRGGGREGVGRTAKPV